MNLSPVTESFQSDDQSWLGSAHGTDMARSITLDVSAFTSGTHYPNGYFPSGLKLGKISASGLYGPYAGRVSEVQTITIDATGGTFTITFQGQTTAAIAWNATAAAVKTAMEALSNIEPGDVSVSLATLVYTFTFGGKYTGENVSAMTTNAASLTGGASTATVATTTAGGAAASDGTEVLAGFLLHAVPSPSVNTIDVQGALYEHGRVIESKLPFTVDAAGKRDVDGRIIFV